MSQHILVTVLGKVKNEQHSNYRPANYAFSATQQRESRFFGLALCEEIKPDKLIVLGTTGSMWDNLLLEAKLLDQDENLLESILNLEKSAQEDNISQTQLDFFAKHLQKILQIPCALCLIPYGRTAKEQTQILKIILKQFNKNDQATLDVTNGLRYLPMLMQQSALLLQTLKKVVINNIYYGAFELMQNNITPVMKINGLLELDVWNQALNSYDKNGDYAVFSPLLRKSGINETLVNHLEQAAFYEQTNNISQARGQLKKFLKGLKETKSSPVIDLFLPELITRFAWVEGNKLWIRQAEVAWLTFENNNFLRACIYGFEAFITKLVQENKKEADKFSHRDEAKRQFESESSNKQSTEWRYYKRLRSLRNQLAHSSTECSPETIRATSSQHELKIALQRIFTTLIPREET